MSVSMDDVKELRQRTSAGVLDCKKALTETDGDIEKAVDYLREKGMSDAADKAGRTASEGKVNIIINEEKDQGIIVEVNSETDFVAKNDNFQDLVNEISQHIMQSNAKNLDQLLNEDWYNDQSKDVNSIIKEAIASIGENINLRRFEKYTTDGFLQGYIHLGGKIGVLVDFEGELNEDTTQTAKNIAMHIAASNPDYVSRNDVDEKVIEKEKQIYREQMLNEGKPEHIIDNIVEGKIDKFYTQICLLEQPFVRDEDITVKELLEESTLSVKRFTRFEVGEGIEEEEEDFASEVMAEMNKE
ncbi:MAG: translation elongation factor Ts [Halanaerobiaceae bacterium]